AWALLHLGKDSEASALIERYLREHPEDRGGLLTSARAFLRAERGDVRGATQDIRRAEAIGAGYIHFHHSASRLASAHVVLHRRPPHQSMATRTTSCAILRREALCVADSLPASPNASTWLMNAPSLCIAGSVSPAASFSSAPASLTVNALP